MKPRAKDLPCIFANLVVIYEQKGLRECEIKESQVWRHASTKEAASRLLLYHTFFPELVYLQTSLELYSLCEKHYNQIISTNHFYQFLLNPNQIANLNSFQIRNKRKRHSIDNSELDIGLNKITSTCDIGIQVSEFKTSTCDFGVQVKTSTRDLGIQVFDESEYKQKTIIQQLQKQLKNQECELMELSKRLIKAYEYIIEIDNQYQEQCKHNKSKTLIF